MSSSSGDRFSSSTLVSRDVRGPKVSTADEVRIRFSAPDPQEDSHLQAPARYVNTRVSRTFFDIYVTSLLYTIASCQFFRIFPQKMIKYYTTPLVIIYQTSRVSNLATLKAAMFIRSTRPLKYQLCLR